MATSALTRSSSGDAADTASSTRATLAIDLMAIVANWRALRDRIHPSECAAVVKADAYGLGARHVVPALAEAGCQTFVVATLDEAIAVRAIAPNNATIYVLNGLFAGDAADFDHHRLRPVLNSLGMIDDWAGLARRAGRPLPAAVHIDTGMSRLGLSPSERALLRDQAHRLTGIEIALVISHLACADEATHPMNERQRQAFVAARADFPGCPASFSNSAGIFLGAPFHFDLCRPGIALYGGNPRADGPNPMQPVVGLSGPILQVREIDPGDTVGYGATYRAQFCRRIATVAIGYADGFLRSLSNRAIGYVGNIAVPLVGRVSMDLTTFDVTAVPSESCRPGDRIEFLSGQHAVDDLASEAGTINYEILTALGRRYDRVYRMAETPRP